MSIENPPLPFVSKQSDERRERYAKLGQLLKEWAEEDPEYDERVGALLEQELKVASVLCGEPDELGS